jgi:hypothetical protein
MPTQVCAVLSTMKGSPFAASLDVGILGFVCVGGGVCVEP